MDPRLGWDMIVLFHFRFCISHLCASSVPWSSSNLLVPDPCPVWPCYGPLCLRSMFSSQLMTYSCPRSLSPQGSPKRTLLHPGPTRARTFHKEYSSEARCLQGERSHLVERRSCGQGPQYTSNHPIITLASLCCGLHPHSLQPQIHGDLGLGTQTSPELCCRCVPFLVVLMCGLLFLHILWIDLGTSSVLPASTLLYLGLLLDPVTTMCLFPFSNWIAVRFHQESAH